MDVSKIEIGAVYKIKSREGSPQKAEEVRVINIRGGAVYCRHLHGAHEQFPVLLERFIKRTRPAHKPKRYVSESYGC